MKIRWKSLLYAGIAGFSAGKAYSWLKRRPSVWDPLVKGAVCAGVSGSVVGMGIAWYRNRPLVFHSISIGATFAFATGSFLGLRYFMTEQSIPLNNYLSNQEAVDYVISGGSGLTVGTLLALLSRSKFVTVILIGTGGLLTGVIGQFSYDQFDLWRKRKAIELNYPDLVDNNKSKELPWSFDRFEKVWLNFWHRQSRAGLIESDIALLEDCIKEERRKIEALDLELANKSIVHIDNRELHKTTKTSDEITANIVQKE